MITKLINDFVSFFNSLFSLVILFYLLKLSCRCFFGFRLKFPRFRNVRFNGVRLREPKHQTKAKYEFKRFKYETKMKYRYQYKLDKYKVKQENRENHRNTSKVAGLSLPNYLRIIK